MMYESSDFGTGGYKTVSSMCEEYGIEMVGAEVYNSGDTDFSVIISKLYSEKPDYFFLWGYHTEAAMICNQMMQYGIKIPVIGYGMNSPELTTLGGAAAVSYTHLDVYKRQRVYRTGISTAVGEV